MSNTLILFAKAPRLGTVKTRLLGELSKAEVRRLYVAFLKDTLALARRVRGVQRRVIAFTPSDAEPLLRRVLRTEAGGFDFVPQQGRDLGERMSHAFEVAANRVVIIGTDSPTLPARLVENAFGALLGNHVVLGPSMDGGYYLIGLRVQDVGLRVRRIFRGVRWSTERVLEQTVRASRRAGLKLHLLAPWYDVDDAASLRFLRAHLEAMAAGGSNEMPRATWRELRRIRS